jgi:hypothetical protein
LVAIFGNVRCEMTNLDVYVNEHYVVQRFRTYLHESG